jgi:RNA polymerase sigma-70 factor, ECF subfamily
MKFIENQEFIINLSTRNESSFTTLYQVYGGKIYHLVLHMLGSKEEAECVTQKIFGQVYRNIDCFQNHNRLVIWIFTIAKNLCYRACKKRQPSSFSAIETGRKANPIDEARFTQRQVRIFRAQIREQCLRDLIGCLSFYQRIAFILHMLLHLSLKDVAEILDKSPGATHVLVHRARQKLLGFLCRYCSLFDPGNSCRCENLILFSLQQGWIVPYSENTISPILFTDAADTGREVECVKTIAELYANQSVQQPSDELHQRILEILKN